MRARVSISACTTMMDFFSKIGALVRTFTCVVRVCRARVPIFRPLPPVKTRRNKGRTYRSTKYTYKARESARDPGGGALCVDLPSMEGEYII